MPPRSLVSVVVPTRDRWQLLGTTLASVLGQRDVDLEVLVVDDGSTTWPAHLPVDRRLSLLRQPESRGVANARNRGLAAARGRYVAFTDDDDLWAPDKLVSQLRAMEATGAAWASCGAVLVDDELDVIDKQRASESGDVGDRMLITNVVPGGGSGVVAETDLVRRLGGFDPDFHMVADWDLWIRLGLAAPLAAVDRPLLAYRLHAGGMSWRQDRTYDELRRLEDKHADERTARGLLMDWPRLELWMADRKQRAGDRVGAARSFLRSSSVIGRPRSLTRALEAVMWPGAQRFRNRRWGRRVPPEWQAEVATWLRAGPDPKVAVGDGAALVPLVRTSERRGHGRRRPDRSALRTG